MTQVLPNSVPEYVKLKDGLVVYCGLFKSYTDVNSVMFYF